MTDASLVKQFLSLYSLWTGSYVHFGGGLGCKTRCFLSAWSEMLGVPHRHVDGLPGAAPYMADCQGPLHRVPQSCDRDLIRSR